MASIDKNMTIVDENDGRLRLRCHCEHEFLYRIRKEKRPTCPKCGCMFNDSDWEIRHAVKMFGQREVRFYKLRFYPPDGKEVIHMLPAHNMWDAVSRCGPILSDPMTQFVVDEVGKDEFIDYKIREMQKEREIPDKVINLLEKLFG